MDVPMVTSPKLSFIANSNNPTHIALAPGETIHFGILEFTTDHLGPLSLPPEEWDSSAIFIGMVHNGVTEPPQKWGVYLPRSYRGIVNEASVCKHNT
jgi:hypothetical protein